jgi:ferric-dicitrate binding protein FerR (iron transport regulator)
MITTRSIAAGVVLLALMGSPASAQQQIPGCTSTSQANPPRTVYRCSGGLIIEAEASASFSVSASRSRGMISAIELRSRGILVELTRHRRFQILTPHAIASVRGTIFAVDVTPAQTSVLVAEGRTQVTRRGRPEAVTLGPGEGVDVTAGGGPLEVRRWPLPRAAALLGRFGRQHLAR